MGIAVAPISIGLVGLFEEGFRFYKEEGSHTYTFHFGRYISHLLRWNVDQYCDREHKVETACSKGQGRRGSLDPFFNPIHLKHMATKVHTDVSWAAEPACPAAQIQNSLETLTSSRLPDCPAKPEGLNRVHQPSQPARAERAGGRNRMGHRR